MRRFVVKNRRYTQKFTIAMEIKRDIYIDKLLLRKGNGMIKIITGMRRSGKSYLLFKLFYDHLLNESVSPDNIIRINLEDRYNQALRDPDALLDYVTAAASDRHSTYYVLLDEIQMVREFEDVLNSFLHRDNLDVYVTGSNARFLSKDVITEFRGRGDEVRIHPLRFAEYVTARQDLSQAEALRDYMLYGGLPQIATMSSDEQRREYLAALFRQTYIMDIRQRYNIRDDSNLEEMIDILASSIGSLVSPLRIRNTMASAKASTIAYDTVKRYIDMLEDAFIVERAVRYDIKGRRYIDTPVKLYFEDLGLRNARLNFRQSEESHLLENLIYNELRIRGMAVDVGQVVVNGKDTEGHNIRSRLEVDFVCNKGFRRYYIQTALTLSSEGKMEQECASLKRINEAFKKIIITADGLTTYQNPDGIIIMPLRDFLLNDTALDI